MPTPVQWIAEYLDGSLEDRQRESFMEWLEADSDNVSLLVDTAFLHSGLYDYFQQEELQSFMRSEWLSDFESVDPAGVLSLFVDAEARERQHARDLAAEQARIEALATERRRRMRDLAERRANRRPEPIVIPRAVPYLAAAVLAFFMFTVLSPLFAPHDQEPIAKAPVVVGEKQELVATLRDSVSAEWAEENLSVTPGKRLAAGSLKLIRGVVEIEFDGGACAVIEAPTELVLISPAAARLAHGSLVGRVPENAKGLTIETPTTTIVDLGTEFGVMAFSGGESTDVHVFEGSVEMQPQPITGLGLAEQQPQRLEVGASVTASDDGSVVSISNLNADRFVRRISEAEKNRFPYGPLPRRLVPVTRELVLWLAADGIVKRDSRNRVSVWGDLCVASNRSPENAEQRDRAKRPLWVDNAIGNKPALRFNGKTTYLATQPLETTDEQTIFCVVQSDPRDILASQSGQEPKLQILNYGGPPHLVLEWSEQLALRGRNYTRDGQGKLNSVGTATGPAHDTTTPIVCGYVYSQAANQALLYEDGQCVAEATAPMSAAVVSSKFIGGHREENRYFVGDLAELMIFNAALEEEEIEVISRYLMEKYRISAETESATSHPVENPERI